jgi:hypothetical protein
MVWRQCVWAPRPLHGFLESVSIGLSGAALAKPPKGAVRGQFTIGILAKYDDLTKYMRWSKCVMRLARRPRDRSRQREEHVV